MPIKTKDLEKKLVQKFGFSRSVTHSDDHRWYQLLGPDGKAIFTKVSHGMTELSSQLESSIARQLRVPTPFFREMINCTKSSEEYKLKLSSNPNPPHGNRV